MSTAVAILAVCGGLRSVRNDVADGSISSLCADKIGPPSMPSDLDARRRSGRRVATLAPRPSQPDGALAPPSPRRSHSLPPQQTELQVCARHSQRRAV